MGQWYGAPLLSYVAAACERKKNGQRVRYRGGQERVPKLVRRDSKLCRTAGGWRGTPRMAKPNHPLIEEGVPDGARLAARAWGLEMGLGGGHH